MEKITLPGNRNEFNKEASSGLQLYNIVESLVTSPPCGHPSGGGEGSEGKEEELKYPLEINQSAQVSENMSTVRNCISENECSPVAKGYSFIDQNKIVDIETPSLSTTESLSTLKVSSEHTEQFPSTERVFCNQINVVYNRELNSLESVGSKSVEVYSDANSTTKEVSSERTEQFPSAERVFCNQSNVIYNRELNSLESVGSKSIEVYSDANSTTKEVSSERTEQFPSTGGVSAGRGGQTSEERNTPNTKDISAGRGGQSPEGRDVPSVEDHIPRNTKNFMSLPYNPKLKKRARALRKAGNLPEVLFWLQVKNKKFKGYDFDRQKIVGNYIVDFYCGNCNVVVEIDGSSHDYKQAYDAIRDSYLQAQGLTVIHIPVVDIMKNMYEVMKMLHEHPALQNPLP